ncbi:uncharacterized protein LOC127080221 [Lathyrus oleraceus]|uniref:uncharacterized protein LOC127080221 n=1 Tax=Pisum sativum TaxID=3888 RepID=UPI0021D13064|nr:uncharacterized protein LOC127080221 [Pisum sativum]
MAHTLEEFERILNCSIKCHNPFPKIEEDFIMPKLSTVFGIDVGELADSWALKGVDKGITRKFLEGHSWKFAKEKKWESCIMVLELLIYGIVLFPNIDNFIDRSAIEVFLSGNPVSFLLVDFYHTFHTRHEKKGGTFMCYDMLFHMWMKAHMPQKGPFVSKDLPWCQKFASLFASTIQWYKREWETQDIVLRYGGFPNAPLVGTHGCINYNHVLCMRQFGHAMNGPPRDEDLVPFIVNGVYPLKPTVRKVRKAWTKIVISGPKLGKKNVIAKESYMQWAKERARIVKIPLNFESSCLPKVPGPKPILQEDVDKLTSKVSELELENTLLRLQLIKEKQKGDDLEDKGKDFPDMMKEADLIIYPDNTSHKVYNFVKFCKKTMIELITDVEALRKSQWVTFQVNL